MIFSPNPQHIHVCNAREEGSNECVERRNLSGSEREGGEEMLKKYTKKKCSQRKCEQKASQQGVKFVCFPLLRYEVFFALGAVLFALLFC